VPVDPAVPRQRAKTADAGVRFQDVMAPRNEPSSVSSSGLPRSPAVGAQEIVDSSAQPVADVPRFTTQTDAHCSTQMSQLSTSHVQSGVVDTLVRSSRMLWPCTVLSDEVQLVQLSLLEVQSSLKPTHAQSAFPG
jgi:hypothetical protein